MRLKIKTLKNMLVALAIIIISTLPYIHDIITISTVGVKSWVPDFGLQKMLTDSNGYIAGFSSYRVFIYTLSIHIFAHIGWVGWYSSTKGKPYRFALLIPVILSLYQITIILFNFRATAFNQPTTKFYITITLSIILILNYFLNNKKNNTFEEKDRP